MAGRGNQSWLSLPPEPVRKFAWRKQGFSGTSPRPSHLGVILDLRSDSRWKQQPSVWSCRPIPRGDAPCLSGQESASTATQLGPPA